MNPGRIKKLGKKAYCNKINGKPRLKRYNGVYIGFDTEYDSKTHELLSIQLWHKDRYIFREINETAAELTLENIYTECLNLIQCKNPPPEIILVSYFSAAELQFMPVIEETDDLREYARGFADVSFPVENCRITVFDLQRFFDGKSLKSAAESFGLEKLEYDTINVSRKTLQDKTFRKYAVHDAYLCYEMFDRLRQQFLALSECDIAVVKTPASAAAHTYRKLFISDEEYKLESATDRRSRLVAMRGTWGGRAEAFRRGKFEKRIYEYDLCSAYPSALEVLKVLPIQGSFETVNSLKNIRNYAGGFARVYFRFPKCVNAPCLPVFEPQEQTLLFPLAGISDCTFHELKVAQDLGAEIDLYEAVGYKTGTNSLTEYCRWTKEMRGRETGARNTMFKLLGNSIIGKTAQTVCKISPIEYLKIKDRYPHFLLEEIVNLQPDYLLALGARETVSTGAVFAPEWFGLITGVVRAELAIMLNSCKAYYCHTDSVWTDTEPENHWLKSEIKMTGKATVIRTRFARIGSRENGHIAHHSVWSREAAHDIIDSFVGKTFVRRYTKQRPLRMVESIRRNMHYAQWYTDMRTAHTIWGEKRVLYGSNTRPLKDTTEYLQNVKNIENAKKQLNL